MQTTNAQITNAQTTDFTKIDLDYIEMLIELGYSREDAIDAYLHCDRDVTLASDWLDTNRQFSKQFQANFSILMDGTLDEDVLLGLGDELDLVEDIHDAIILEDQLV